MPVPCRAEPTLGGPPRAGVSEGAALRGSAWENIMMIIIALIAIITCSNSNSKSNSDSNTTNNNTSNTNSNNNKQIIIIIKITIIIINDNNNDNNNGSAWESTRAVSRSTQGGTLGGGASMSARESAAMGPAPPQ